MQSEPRHDHVRDYYVRVFGILHDLTQDDIQHVITALGDHIRHYGGKPYQIELEEVG